MSEQTAIRIKNKDIPRLREILPLMQEISALESRRGWQRDRMEFITQRISDMPRGGGEPCGLDAACAEMLEADERQYEGVRRYSRELKELEKIINSVTSPFMRSFVLLFYVEDLPPKKVKSELNMTERGFRNARAAVEQASCMAEVKWRDKFVLEDGNEGRI